MIAYSAEELYNCNVLSQARDACSASKISQESFEKIGQAYPCKLYRPNTFIAIALGLLTILAISFTTFLFGLLTVDNFSSDLAVLFAFMAVVSYITLELMVKSKKYFNAGIDNALMIAVLAFVAGIFINYASDLPWILMNGILMAVSLWLSFRFVDAFMASIACAFFFLIFYLLLLRLGASSIIFISLPMMMLICGMYLILKKIRKGVGFIYEKNITVLIIFLLISFYAAGNYWVVNELQTAEFGGKVSANIGWIFWVLTCLIPFVYIFYGVVKKDLLHIRTGVLLLFIMVLTYKYYFSLLPVEVEMLFLGIILIVLSYFLIKWLRKERYGFTSEMISAKPAWKNIEGILVVETMGGGVKPQQDTLMSGGSAGGGGASGEF